jgi:transposase-like protein
MSETLRDEARRLRTDEQLPIRQIQARLGVSRRQLLDWLRDIVPPDRTRRPNAKDDLRSRAVELRVDGWSINDIALELGVAKSTVSVWVRHLPLDPDTERARQKALQAKRMSDGRWAAYRADRDARHAAVVADAARWVDGLTDRELLLVGSVMYWCEGEKVKPWRKNCLAVAFINSDPVLISLFLRFLAALGFDHRRLTYRVSIHESADAGAATRWWAATLGVPADIFQRPTLKHHRATTRRKNVGDDYHGCLIVKVPRGRELYWRIEGIMAGLAGACAAAISGPCADEPSTR